MLAPSTVCVPRSSRVVTFYILAASRAGWNGSRYVQRVEALSRVSDLDLPTAPVALLFGYNSDLNGARNVLMATTTQTIITITITITYAVMDRMPRQLLGKLKGQGGLVSSNLDLSDSDLELMTSKSVSSPKSLACHKLLPIKARMLPRLLLKPRFSYLQTVRLIRISLTRLLTSLHRVIVTTMCLLEASYSRRSSCCNANWPACRTRSKSYRLPIFSIPRCSDFVNDDYSHRMPHRMAKRSRLHLSISQPAYLL